MVGKLEGLVQSGRVVAAIIGHQHRGLVRVHIRLDEVLPPEVRRIHLQVAGRPFDQPLDDEGRLRPARTPIGVDRRGVGVDPVDLGVDRRDDVLTRQQGGVQIGRRRGAEQVRVAAEIGVCPDPQAEDPAVGVGRQLRLGDMVAAMGVGHEALGPLGGPLDRPSELHRGVGAGHLLGIDVDLRAEAAADIRGDHAQLVLRRQGDEGRHHQPRHMRVLAGGVQGVLVHARVVVAQGGPRLHRVGGQPVVDDVERRHMGGVGERGLGLVLVAEGPEEGRVVRRLVMELRRVVSRGIGRADHMRQLVISDLQPLGRVLGLGEGFGDDDRHRVAHIAHPFGLQDRMAGGAHAATVPVVDHPACRQRAGHAVGGEIVPGEHAEHTGHRFGGRLVDAGDPGMRERRPGDVGIGLAGTVEIVDVAALAGQKPLVFLAAQRGADAIGCHGADPSLFWGWRTGAVGSALCRRAEDYSAATL